MRTPNRWRHTRLLSLAATARRLGQLRFAAKLLVEAKWTRYCPYHRQFDALERLP